MLSSILEKYVSFLDIFFRNICKIYHDLLYGVICHVCGSVMSTYKNSQHAITIISTLVICVFAALPWWIFGNNWLDIWSTYVDHCAMVVCDFQRHYLPQIHMFANQDWRIQPGWYYPPIVALILSPLAWVSNPIAVWIGCNLILLVIFAMVMVRVNIVSIFKNSMLLWKVFFAIALLSTSFPILHGFKWGQISLLVILLSTWSLLQDKNGQTQRSVLAAILLGLAISIKWYPLVYLWIPMMEKRWKWIRLVVLSMVVWSVCIPWLYVGQYTWWYIEHSLQAGVDIQNVASFGGGQSITASATRWFLNGSHVGLSSSMLKNTQPMWMLSQIGYGMTICSYVVFSVWALLWKYQKKERWVQLIIVMLLSQLWLSPAWHHYFAFLSVAMLWLSVGIDRRRKTFIWSMLAIIFCFVVERIPMLILCYSQNYSGYELYSQYGTTTILTTILLIVALIGTKDLKQPHTDDVVS